MSQRRMEAHVETCSIESDPAPSDNEPAEVTRSRVEQNIDILKQELSSSVTMDSVRTKVLER